ncbi:MAG: hypothetical protein ACR2NQ_01175 [Thermodesulfobacteriota bacterium]
MGLTRILREREDPWDVRLEEQRKDAPQDRETSSDSSDDEEKEVLRKRKMFGKVFSGKAPE